MVTSTLDPMSGTEPEPPSTTVAFTFATTEGVSPSSGLVSALGPLGRRGGIDMSGNDSGSESPTGIGERLLNFGERER